MQPPRQRAHDVRHDGGAPTYPGALRRPDHAGLQVRQHLAAQCRTLARATRAVAATEQRGRGEDGGLRPTVEGEHLHEGETIGGRGRRVGHLVPRRRDDASAARLSPEVPEHPAHAARPPPRPARKADRELPSEDAAAVRVREAPARVGLGRDVPGRPH